MAIVTDIYQGRARVTFQEKRHTYSIRVHGHVEKLWQPSVTGIIGVKAKPALTNWAAKKSLECVGKKLGTYESKLGTPPFTIDTKEIHSWLAEAADSWNEEEATTIGTVAHRFLHAELQYRTGISPNRPKLPLVVDPVMAPDFTPGMIDQANASVLAGIEFFDQHNIEPLMMERPLWSPDEGYVGTVDLVAKIDGELAVVDYKTSKRIYSEYWIQLAAYQHMFMTEFPGQVVKMRYALNTKKDGSGLEVEKRGLDSYSDDLNTFRALFTTYQWERANDPYKKGSPIQVLGDLDSLIARQ